MSRRAFERDSAAITRQVSRREPFARPSVEHRERFGPAATWAFALQRSLGNRAFSRLVQREVTKDPPGTWVTEGARGRAREAVEERLKEQTTHRKELEHVAEDVIGEELGVGIRPSPDDPIPPRRVNRKGKEQLRSLEDRLREAARGTGPEAEAAQKALRERSVNKRWLNKRLEEIAAGKGPRAEEARRLLRELREAEKEAGRMKRILKPKGKGAGAAKRGARPISYAAESTAGKAEERVGKTATKAEEAGAGGLGKAAVKAEEVVAEVAAKPKLYKRVAAQLGKLGVELIEGLVPDPLDALELMYDFAGSYKEAWDRIKQDNLTNGFAMGLAAYLVIPRWEWAKYWARTNVSRDVATQVIGAVGIAENAYNEGLVRGFLYGEKHSKAQADRLRQKAFNALVKVGNMPGHYDEGEDLYTFGRNDVYLFAAVLHPTAAAVLNEADRRKAARIESEKLREDMKKWSRRQPGEV